MPEPEALLRRKKLGDGDAINLTIVEDDGFKLPNCLTSSDPDLVRVLDAEPEKLVAQSRARGRRFIDDLFESSPHVGGCACHD